MTLVPDATADEVLAVVGDRRPVGVKDSFARIDLSPAGLDLLLDGSWIGLVGPVRRTAAATRAVGDDRLGPDVVVLEVVRAGDVIGRGTGHRDGAVVGLSNVEAGAEDDLGEVLATLVAAVRSRFGDVPLVGYEHGSALDAALGEGFSVVGPLRVWVGG